MATREARWLAGWGLAVVVMLCSVDGFAGVEDDAGGDQEVALSDEQAALYREAMESLDGSPEGIEEARTLLEAAVIVGDESEMLLMALGRTHQLAGDCAEAVQLYDESREAPPAAEVPADEIESSRRDYRRELRDECDGLLYVDCRSAETALSSQQLGELECNRVAEVEPGDYDVEATLAGVVTSTTAEVVAGRRTEVQINLRSREDAPEEDSEQREETGAVVDEPEADRRREEPAPEESPVERQEPGEPEVEQRTVDDEDLDDEVEGVALTDSQQEAFQRAVDALEESPPDTSTAVEELERLLAGGASSEAVYLKLGRALQLRGACQQARSQFDASEEAPPTAGLSRRSMARRRGDYWAQWELQCGDMSNLYLNCRSRGTEVEVDELEDAECHRPMAVAPGNYDIEARRGNQEAGVTVLVGDSVHQEVLIDVEGEQLVAEVGTTDRDIPAELEGYQPLVFDKDEPPETDDDVGLPGAGRAYEPGAEADEPDADKPGDDQPEDDQPEDEESDGEEVAEVTVDDVESEPVELAGGRVRWTTLRPRIADGTASRGRDKLPEAPDEEDGATSHTSTPGQESRSAADSASSAPTTGDSSSRDRTVPSRFDWMLGLGFEFGEAVEPLLTHQMMLYFWYLGLNAGLTAYPSPTGHMPMIEGDSDVMFNLGLFVRLSLGDTVDFVSGLGIWRTWMSDPGYRVDPQHFDEGTGYVDDRGLEMKSGLRFAIGDSRALYLIVRGHHITGRGYYDDGGMFGSGINRIDTFNPTLTIGWSPL